MISVVDIVLGIFLAYTTWKGLRRGLVRSGFDILGLVVAVLVALAWYRALAELALNFVKINPSAAYIVVFILLWLVIYAVISFFGSTLHRFVRASFFGTFDLVGGGGLGLLKGMVIISLVLQLIFLSPLVPLLGSELENSLVTRVTYPMVSAVYAWVFPMLPQNMPNFQDFIKNFNKGMKLPEVISIKGKK